MPTSVTKGMGFNSPKPSNNLPKGNNYLLVIGIDHYAHFPQLNNAVKDAKDMVDVLLKKFQFKKDFTKTLFDKEATKENIYAAFRDLAQRTTSADNVIIYFSGHGEFDSIFDEGYWIPIEAEAGKVDQYVPNSMIKRILNSIKSHHIFLMIDSCFSGTLFAVNLGRNAAMRKERDPSRWGLTAGRNEVVNDGISGHNSPFAESLLYQLKNATQSIGVAELCDNVLEVVSANAHQTPRGEPLKVNGHRGGQFVFHLKRDELSDWKESKTIGTLQALQAFLLTYPEGKYAATAKAKIKTLRADLLWAKIDQAKDDDLKSIKVKLHLVNQFVDTYESEPHYEEVLNIGQLLEYKKEMFLAQSGEFALRKFLRLLTPNLEGAIEIRNQAQQILNQLNSRIDHNVYVETSTNESNSFPNTSTKIPHQANPSQKDKAKKEGITNVNLDIPKENDRKNNSNITEEKSYLEKYWKAGIVILLTALLAIAVLILIKMYPQEVDSEVRSTSEEVVIDNEQSSTSPLPNSESNEKPDQEETPSPTKTENTPPKKEPRQLPPKKPKIRYKTHKVQIQLSNGYREWNKKAVKFRTKTKTVQVTDEYKKGAVLKNVTEQIKVKDAYVTYQLKEC
ncbi:MAG: caspase family protein, partial [Bacteroidota bacterium]